MKKQQCLYAVLGVEPSADEAQIKKAYRKDFFFFCFCFFFLCFCF
jgi:hypothetical protein